VRPRARARDRAWRRHHRKRITPSQATHSTIELQAPWDAYVDPAHWQSAFKVRLIGAAIIVATGLFQQLPGMGQWLPLMAKTRLVISLVAATVAASTLDRGYGFAVAGVVAIILTGPYIAIDVRDHRHIDLPAG
jgi:hypothetical protein